MATLFLPLAHMFEAVNGLLAWFAPRQPRRASAPQRRAPSVQRQAQAPARPLRVLRVVEPSAPRAVAGRMVISGRMADVCAELDRLAAQEARAH